MKSVHSSVHEIPQQCSLQLPLAPTRMKRRWCLICENCRAPHKNPGIKGDRRLLCIALFVFAIGLVVCVAAAPTAWKCASSNNGRGKIDEKTLPPRLQSETYIIKNKKCQRRGLARHTDGVHKTNKNFKTFQLFCHPFLYFF